jgi:UDP-glucuronate 4-epimerase
MKIVSLRIFTAFGPRQRPDLAIHHFVNQILNEDEIILYGDGTTYRDYTFVGDLVNGILAAGSWLEETKPGTHEIFNLGSGRPVTLHELILDLEAVLKVKAKIKHEGFRLGDVSRTYADISKSKKVLGYQPVTTLAEGLYEFIQWHSLTSLNQSKSHQKVA